MIAVLGILGNMISFFVIWHPEMRSFCSMLIHGLLLSDSVYLICLVVSRSPVSWLFHWYAITGDEPAFWGLLDRTQRMYIAAYPVKEIGWCLMVWYTSAIFLEQLCIYLCPARLSNWSKPQCAIKITITIAICALLAHLLSFFKYTRLPVNYHTYNHMTICLSQLYRDTRFQVYDQYIYMILFIFIPSFAACCTVPRMLYAYRTSKFPDLTHCNRSTHMTSELTLGRVFKSGRSTHLVAALATAFFICQVTTLIIYIEVIVDLDLDPLSARCHKLPEDRIFEHQDPALPLVHYLVSATYAAINLPLFLAFGQDFRRTFLKTFRNLCRSAKDQKEQQSQRLKRNSEICDELFDQHHRRSEVEGWLCKTTEHSTYI